MRLTWSAVGLASSLPKMPSSGAVMPSVRSIGGTGRLLGDFGRVVDDDAAAPAIDGGVDVRDRRRGEVGVAAAAAEADDADLAAGVRLGAQEAHRAFDVAHRLRVRDAAIGASAGRDVIRVAAAHAGVEVG